MTTEIESDFEPTSTWLQFMRDREYPEELIQELLEKRRQKESQ